MSYRVLITGSSRGFGRLFADTLLKAGHAVVATMRDPDGRNAGPAGELRAQGAEVVALDVTDQASIKSCVAEVGEIDVLVNNAGVGILGIQEAYTVDDWKQLFELNVFGVQRVTAAFVPSMRSRGQGAVVFISSILGRMCLPFFGPYNASKWAVEAMAENYRVELSGFGVESLLIEPGGFPTDFAAGLLRSSNDPADLGYGEMAAAPQMMLENFEQTLSQNPQQDPQLVGDALRDLLAQQPGDRPFRTVVDTLGMGAAVEPYNAQLEGVTTGIYGAFEIAHMLELKRS